MNKKNIWNLVQDDLSWDGSLRDIYILNTNISDWNKFLNYIKNNKLKCEFYNGKLNIEDLITRLPEIFSEEYDRRFGPLSIYIGDIQLNCHFFNDKEIEFDLDTREIKGEEEFNDVLKFMENISNVLNKDSILTPESYKENPILIYSTQNKEFKFIPSIIKK